MIKKILTIFMMKKRNGEWTFLVFETRQYSAFSLNTTSPPPSSYFYPLWELLLIEIEIEPILGS